MDRNYSEDQDRMEEESGLEKHRRNLFKKRGNEKASSSNSSWIKKIGIKNLCILLVLGLALIVLCWLGMPETTDKKTKTVKPDGMSESLEANPIYGETENDQDEYVSNLEKRLEDLLTNVKGVGKVEVMITLSESKELVTLKDTPYTHDSVKEDDGEGGKRDSYTMKKDEATVMSTMKDGSSSPYVIKELQPTVEGVVVTAQGGADNKIKLDIVEAVEALFDVPTHKIKVLAMKETK